MALGLTRKLQQLLPDRHMVHIFMEMVGNRSFTLTTGKAERSRLPPEMITEPEWTPAGVWNLGWSRSRSHYFWVEPEQEPDPESTLRSVQEPIKNFNGRNFCNDAGCCQTD